MLVLTYNGPDRTHVQYNSFIEDRTSQTSKANTPQVESGHRIHSWYEEEKRVASKLILSENREKKGS